MQRLMRSGGSYQLIVGVIIGILLAGLLARLRVDTTAVSGIGADGGLGAETQSGAGRATGAGAAHGPQALGSRSPRATGGSDGGGEAGLVGDTAGPGARNVQLTASDVGVSAKTIKIGVVLLDLGGAAAFGVALPGFDPEVQQKGWQTFIDDINRNGGINGRKLTAYYAKADPVNANSQRAACLDLTQDKKVFLVIDAFSSLGTSQLCVSAENRRVGITAGLSPTEYYQQSEGRLISLVQHGNRFFADTANAFHRLGKLKGRKLGILMDQDRSDLMVNGGFIPTLKRLGYKVTYVANVSGDPSQGPSQIPPQVQQMRLAGVNSVFFATNFVNVTAFANNADKQGWRPQYLLNDWGGVDVGSLNDGMPDSFNGAMAITDFGFTSRPVSPLAKACVAKYNKATGDNYTVEGTPREYNNTIVYCETTRLVRVAGVGAGNFLTREGFSRAVQGLGNFEWLYLGGRFGPGKTDWDDFVRAIVWGPKDGSSLNCSSKGDRCWNDAGREFDP
jgi:ABC-type branched-subunit amino acid transport system substrate-binding protein